MNDYENIQTIEAQPKASSMIETFRAIGYSLETAVADIIDNSISAKAKNIFINRTWKGGKSFITIKDDGIGMNNAELIQAMRPGFQNPLDEREKTDLGRFGLGLKTASFSQCRNLTVLSKKADYNSVYWTWNLDHVAKSDKWELLKWIPQGFEHELDSLNSGTIVIWTELDRILSLETSETDSNAHRKFSDSLDRVKRHIAMTFHRFIEEKSIKIHWCGHEIEPWNPFCVSETKTQEKSTDNLPGGVTVKGFVLPHKNNFSSEQAYKQAEGINGWSAQQGFYVYRGKRLLLAGDWLGLRRKEECFKLVRIQIDLPNTLDTDWHIDIKKSRAYPPSKCRDQLGQYAKSVCNDGLEVYKHRGKILKQRAGTSFQPLWLEKKKDDKWYFVVNRENSIIQSLKQSAKDNPENAIETLLKFIEESLPTKSVYINEAKADEEQKTPYSDFDTSIIKDILCRIYKNKLDGGLSEKQAKAVLKTIEPFNNYEEIIDEL
jgi:hypothetical protein